MMAEDRVTNMIESIVTYNMKYHCYSTLLYSVITHIRFGVGIEKSKFVWAVLPSLGRQPTSKGKTVMVWQAKPVDPQSGASLYINTNHMYKERGRSDVPL